MAKNSQCTSCGLIHQRCQCRWETSTTHPAESVENTQCLSVCCEACLCYIITVVFLLLFVLAIVSLTKVDANSSTSSCYVELFANSVSVSNANVSAADWKIGFVTRSPVSGCEISLHPLSSRLLRGSQVISNPPSPSPLALGNNNTDIVFEKVVMPEVTGDVIWDLRVEIMYALKTSAIGLRGLLTAVCPDIPVKFTTDPAGKMMGSLLGDMRRCEYKLRADLA